MDPFSGPSEREVGPYANPWQDAPSQHSAVPAVSRDAQQVVEGQKAFALGEEAVDHLLQAKFFGAVLFAALAFAFDVALAGVELSVDLAAAEAGAAVEAEDVVRHLPQSLSQLFCWAEERALRHWVSFGVVSAEFGLACRCRASLHFDCLRRLRVGKPDLKTRVFG